MMLPAAATLGDGSFVSVVHPVKIFSGSAVEIDGVTRAMEETGEASSATPVVIVWKLI